RSIGEDGSVIVPGGRHFSRYVCALEREMYCLACGEVLLWQLDLSGKREKWAAQLKLRGLRDNMLLRQRTNPFGSVFFAFASGFLFSSSSPPHPYHYFEVCGENDNLPFFLLWTVPHSLFLGACR
ncbi:hypothetical protein TcCL_NonESM01003, partial [Trypanosoma cruzi]